MVNLAQAWAEDAISIRHQHSISRSIRAGGSGTGVAALINGTVDNWRTAVVKSNPKS